MLGSFLKKLEVIIWGSIIPFPNPNSLAHLLLELTAISGELPFGLVPNDYSRNYVNNVLSHLCRIGLMRVYHRESVRGYRLTAKAKRGLLTENYDRYSLYLTGNVETNLVKSELSRRIRLHRLAEIYLYMLQCDIPIFRDQKPVIFIPEKEKLPPIRKAAFYTPREIRLLEMDTIKLRGSRICGALMTPDGVYLTYNCITGLNKFDYRNEDKVRSLLITAICYERLYHQFIPSQVRGLLIGTDLSAFAHVIASSNSNVRSHFLLDGKYQNFYYLTNDHYGAVLMRLLCDIPKKTILKQVLLQDLQPANPDCGVENDGFDRHGNPVLLGYFMDIARINRFCIGLRLQKKHGIIICFDFQRKTLAELFGSLISVQAISFKNFERRFFPSENENT